MPRKFCGRHRGKNILKKYQVENTAKTWAIYPTRKWKKIAYKNNFRHLHNMALNQDAEEFKRFEEEITIRTTDISKKNNDSLHFLSLNVKGINANNNTTYTKLKALSQYGDKNDQTNYRHIIMLQETNSKDVDKNVKLLMEANFIHHRAFVHGISNETQKGQGLITLIDNEWSKYLSNTESFIGRLQMFDLDTPGTKNGKYHMRFINIYGPSGFNTEESKSINKLIAWKLNQWIIQAEKSERSITIAGDWNGVASPELDRINKSGNTPETEPLMLMNSHGMTDIYRALNPDNKTYTYKHHGTECSRIDAVYTSLEMLNKIITTSTIDIEHNQQTLFDHVAVTWTIRNNSENENNTNFYQAKGKLQDVLIIETKKASKEHWKKYTQLCRVEVYEKQLDASSRAYHEIESKDHARVWCTNFGDLFSKTLVDIAKKTLPVKTIKGDKVEVNFKKHRRLSRLILSLRENVKNEEKNNKEDNLQMTQCQIDNIQEEIEEINQLLQRYDLELPERKKQDLGVLKSKRKQAY
jgi:exonuclease III